MFMCVVNLKSVNKLDLTWKQSFLILFYTRKHILFVGMQHGWTCVFPRKRGWNAGVGRSSSIKPNSRILIENPLANPAGHKNDSTQLVFKSLQTYIFHISI
jgi:hypothetical protein